MPVRLEGQNENTVLFQRSCPVVVKFGRRIGWRQQNPNISAAAASVSVPYVLPVLEFVSGQLRSSSIVSIFQVLTKLNEDGGRPDLRRGL